MPSKIEALYGTPPAVDALWRELEARLDAETLAELRAVYRRASVRYSAAARLYGWRRQLRYGRFITAAAQAALADPQAWIDAAERRGEGE